MISTYDTTALEREFKTIKEPKTKLIQVVDRVITGAPEAIGDKIKLGFIKRIVTPLFDEHKLRAAAWGWTRPTPFLGIDRVDGLRARLGLAHLSKLEFCERVIEACQTLRDEHQDLSRHIDSRIVDLEFVARSVSTLEDPFANEFDQYQRQLLDAALDGDADASEDVSSLALAAAAAVVRSVLDEKKATRSFHANLMVRAAHVTDLRNIANDLRQFAALPGFQQAARLWAGIDESPHGVLVVVAETEGSQYRGFWMPDLRINGLALPGAPRALGTSEPQALFVDDLPPFPLDPEIGERWKKYLKGERAGQFEGCMFVSIPVFRRTDNLNLIASAVINVNLIGVEPWLRAYSKHWLAFAATRANAWASTAVHAAGLAFSLRGRTISALQLPTFEIPLLPPKSGT